MAERHDGKPHDPSGIAPLQDLTGFFTPIRVPLDEVERILFEQAAAAPAPLDGMLHHAIAGGKRMRPAVILLIGALLSGDASLLTRIAAAVEVLHVATLIHDDIIDDTSVRRGRETVHVRWSVRDAVLAGDYLLAAAARRIAAIGDTSLMGVFADTLSTVCIGQIREVQIEPGGIRGLDAYRRDIEAKTASLIAGACEMTGIMCGAPDEVVSQIREFGRQLGIAFQIADDVLDFIGEESWLGKPRGSDLRQGLVTLPVLLYLQNGGTSRRVLDVIEAGGNRSAAAVARAIDIICSSGAIDAAAAEAQRHARQALSVLGGLPALGVRGPGPVRAALRGLVAYTALRGR